MLLHQIKRLSAQQSEETPKNRKKYLQTIHIVRSLITRISEKLKKLNDKKKTLFKNEQ
jgi:hypothetical protein